MLPKGLPEKTLGWGVLNWASYMLTQPDGKNQGEPWRFSDEQAMFLLWFYAVDDTGEYSYRNAVLERPKGWGKSPLLAAICCAELLGPVTFSHFNNRGEAIGRETYSPLVQIAAISDSQAENTMALVREMLSNDRIKMHYPGLEVHISRVTRPGGAKLEKVTASPRGREGNRATFVVMDETHLWVPAEKGPELYEALSRNLAKMNKRWVATTNAPVPGEGSVAELHHDGYEKMVAGEAFDTRMLFDTREVYVENIYDPETALPALREVYGDAAHPVTGWINLDRIWAEINDPTTREHVARRFYFNQRVTGHTTWLQKKLWIEARKGDIRLKQKDLIALGFKGNTTRGAALVACRLTDKALFNLGWWENNLQLPGWEVPFHEVDARVRKVLNTYDVVKLLADPTQYQDIIGRWYSDFEDEVEEFWINNKTKMAKAIEQFESSVYSKRLTYEDSDISRHILNCHAEEVPQGYIIRQENKHSFRYIFGAQAAVLALEAAIVAIEEGALNKRDNTLYIF